METSKTALITIDFINDIVHPDGKIPSCAAMVAQREVLARTNRAIAWARAHAVPVVHVKVGFHPDYANCPSGSPVFGSAARLQALQLGGWGCELHAALDVQPQDFIDVKSRVSIFYGTRLESLLRARRIEHLVLAGVSSNMAVEMAAREAHDRDYQATVLADCCAAASAELHAQCMSGTLARLAHVIDSSALPA
jgi:nicotinamidase-related amidase